MRVTLGLLLTLAATAALAQEPPLNSPPQSVVSGGKPLPPRWEAKTRQIYKTAVEIPTVKGRAGQSLKLATYLGAQLKAAGWAERDIHVLP
jgi:hypothetical protein